MAARRPIRTSFFSKPNSNVPKDLAPIFGRTAERRRLLAAVTDGARLIAVVGAPGIGKSHFALHALAHWLPAARGSEYPGGSWYCDCSAYEDWAEIETMLCRTFGLEGAPNGAAAASRRLIAALSERGPSLLLLDGVDTLLESGTMRHAELLAQVPSLVLLVTAQRRTGPMNEVPVELPPLSLPRTPDEIEQSESGEHLLFCLSQRTGEPFVVQPHERHAFFDVVTELDGLPLANNLGAAQIHFLGVSAAATTSVVKHASLERGALRSALDASWSALGVAEQEVFAQCSVFAGSFDPVDASGVLRTSTNDSALGILQRLHERSILSRENNDNGQVRYRLLGALNAFAELKLAELGLESATRERFVEGLLRKIDARISRDDLWGDKENLRRAARWAKGARDKGNLLLALHDVVGGAEAAEMDKLVSEVLSTCVGDGIDTALRVDMLLMRASTRRSLGKSDLALEDIQEARRLAMSTSDAPRTARALAAHGVALLAKGDLQGAHQWLCDAAELARAQGLSAERAAALSSHGAVLVGLGKSDQAVDVAQEALVLYERIHDERGAAAVQAVLGNYLIDKEDYAGAHRYLQRAYRTLREYDDHFGRGFARAALGILAHLRGDLAEARSNYRAALTIFRYVGASVYEGAFSGYLGIVEAELQNTDLAHSLFKKAYQRLRDAADWRFSSLFGCYLALIEAQLGLFAEARARWAECRETLEATGDAVLNQAVSVLAPAYNLRMTTGAEAAPDERAIAAASAQSQDVFAGRALGADARLASRVLALHVPGVPNSWGSAAADPADVVEADVRVDRGGAWWQRGKMPPIKIPRHAGRILVLLAEAHSGGQPLAMSKLIEAIADPGVKPSVLANRVRVAIGLLRSAGLRDLLETVGREGYRLRPGLGVEIVDAAQGSGA